MGRIIPFEPEVESNYNWNPTSGIDKKDACEKAEFLMSFSSLFFISDFRFKILFSFTGTVRKAQRERQTSLFFIPTILELKNVMHKGTDFPVCLFLYS